MNPLHLLWIIPLSAAAGAVLMGIIAGGTREDRWYDETPSRNL